MEKDWLSVKETSRKMTAQFPLLQILTKQKQKAVSMIYSYN